MTEIELAAWQDARAPAAQEPMSDAERAMLLYWQAVVDAILASPVPE